MRALVDLRQDKLEDMNVFCKQYHISRAELVRRAIDQFLETHRTQTDVFGILKNKKIDALQYQTKLRDEW